MEKKLTIMLVAGARPNFMKIAPLMKELHKRPRVKTILVHTGQHYDKRMSEIFFKQLGIPKPDINLEIHGGSVAAQMGKIVRAFDKELQKNTPDLVIVVGDVTSTLACSIAASQRGVKVAHVEAGLRSFDWEMPEEVNRVLTDQLSDFLFCTEKSGTQNLRHEGVDRKKTFFVGNVMIDTLLTHIRAAEKSQILGALNLTKKKYAVLTLHRPSNVDDQAQLKNLLSSLHVLTQHGIEAIFPVHPRTAKNLKKWHIKAKNVTFTEPLGYLDFLHLMRHALLVLTDSGGIQEETTILGVPCLTLRTSTERPVTVSNGTNRIVGIKRDRIVSALKKVMQQKKQSRKRPPLWDGKAAERIVKILLKKL